MTWGAPCDSPRQAGWQFSWGIGVSTEKPPNAVFDDLGAAVDALEVGVNFMEQAQTNAQRLRWAIIAIHQALQGFMVTALRGTEGSRPLAQNSAKRLLRELRDYVARRGPFPSQARRLDDFLNLYLKVKDPSAAGMGQLVTSRAFGAEPEDDRATKELNDLRNIFVHLTPGTWILYPADAIAPLRSALKVISFLAFESQNILWTAHAEDMQAQTRQLVARGSQSLDRLSAVYT
jgi:hypothetical protein